MTAVTQEPEDNTVDLTEIHARYTEASTRASDVARQLAFAGIAIVWFFGGGTVGNGSITLNDALLLPGALLVVSLLLDFLQHAYRTALWGVMGTVFERWKKQTSEINYSPKWLWPVVVLMWSKLLALGLAYLMLAAHFLSAVEWAQG